MPGRTRKSGRTAALLGLSVTGLVAALRPSPLLTRLELIGYDVQVRYLHAMPVDPRIVLITISDRDLEVVGRWPWPRDVQAALVSIPAELGARAILLDLEYLEPQPLRADLPPDADMLVEPSAGPDLLEAVHADRVLASALEQAGQAYLAFHYLPAARRENEASRDLRAAIRRWLEAHGPCGEAPLAELARQIWPQVSDRPFEIDTPRRRAFFAALREALSLRATRRRRWSVRGQAVAPIAPVVGTIVPVYRPHALAAAGCGFVNFDADLDGIVRRLQLFVRHDEVVYTQLALRLAADLLSLDPQRVRIHRGGLELPRGAGRPLSIPLDSRGRVLVPWTTQRFDSLAARALIAIDENRRRIETNRRILFDWLDQVLADPAAPQAAAAREQIAALRRLYAQLAEARRSGRSRDAADLRLLIDPIEAALRQLEQQAREHVRAALTRSDLLSDRSAHLRALADTFARIDTVRANNARIQATIRETLTRLRQRLAGRICLIGYTATSLADIKPTPVDAASPGLLTHANLLNGLLTGRMLRAAPPPAGTIATLAVGLLATALSLGRRPRVAFWSVFALLLAYTLTACGLLFARFGIALSIVAPLVAGGGSYLAIALHHYFFVDRERRALAAALSQFTAREIAEKVAEDPELCRRVELREVTPMFTDLRGFTTLAERLGPQRTQQLLNRCLGELTEVLLRHQALVNKFLGDGVFAFWNAVILPADDHATRACAAALDLLAAIERLGGDDAFADRLHLRVGIASGQAIVGPCGSPQKYDYTCIGDAVNVAARLESANRFFGTQVLVNDQTRRAADDGFAFRSLGGVRVKGRREPVPVFELLGRRGQVAPETLAYAEAFAEAVAAFQQRSFAEAAERFAVLLDRRPGDLAARLYRDAASAWQHAPPAKDWNGAIELTEK